jgi:hypothetical protein
MNRGDLLTAGPEFFGWKDGALWAVASGESSIQLTVRWRGTKREVQERKSTPSR